MGICLKIRDLKLEEKQKELDQALKERDDFKVKLEKWSNASVLQNEVLNKQRYVSDKSCIGFGIESSDISSGDETLTDSTYENFKREKRPTKQSTSLKDLEYHRQYFHEVLMEVIIQGWNSKDQESKVTHRHRVIYKGSHRHKRPKKIVKSIWVKKGSTVGSQAVLPQTVKKSAMINPKQTWKPKGKYLDSVNRGNGSYTLKQFELCNSIRGIQGNPEEDLKDYVIIDSGCSSRKYGQETGNVVLILMSSKGGFVCRPLETTLKVEESQEKEPLRHHA
ncbi:hypothetical protein Tco_1570552 [Tanacetum coccineum]